MPAELALLPIVESAYDPFAFSSGRALGTWQFIADTGRRYESVFREIGADAADALALEYLNQLRELLGRIEATQLGKIDQAAEMAAEAMCSGGSLVIHDSMSTSTRA